MLLQYHIKTIFSSRACLGLNPEVLSKLSGMVFRLAMMPCLMETGAVTLASHLMMGLPWAWAAMLGFALAAVSPAVVVSCLLSLQERGYGVVKVRGQSINQSIIEIICRVSPVW